MHFSTLRTTHFLLVGMLSLLGSHRVQATPPAITSAANVEVYFDAGDPANGQFSYRIVATNGPTAFTANGLPPEAALNDATGWINGNRNAPGIYDTAIRASNADGAAVATVRFSIHPAVIGVRSSPGVFRSGQSFTVTLHYNAIVAVTGTPQLTLMVGAAGTVVAREATYVSGSGTGDLVFQYTVASGDDDPDGVQLLSDALHGGVIAEASGLVASATLPVKYFLSGITVVGGASGVGGPGAMPAAAAAPVSGSRLANVSARLKVAAGEGGRSLIAGFVVSGEVAKRVLVRAVGPALGGFGVPGALSDPSLRVFSGAGVPVAENDNWTGRETSEAAASVGAFALATGSRDAAAVVTLVPGVYTLVVGANGGEGVALAEVYDLDSPAAAGRTTITNLSTRGHVEGGDGTLIAGFAITGTAPRRVLIRGIGPTLTAFGVTDALRDPTLRVFQGSRLVAENDNWSAGSAEAASAAATAGAFALVAGSRDAAVVLTLAPGAYSAVVGSADGLSGSGLVEVYELPESGN